MQALIVILFTAIVSTAAVWAQDWRFDEAHDLNINCALIARLKADFREEAILKLADGELLTLADSFDESFAVCAPIADAEATDVTAAAPENEREVIAVLEDHDEFTLFDISCSVRVTDRFDANLNLSLAGHGREETSGAVFLPGENEKIEMPNVRHELINVYGIETPIRNEWVEGDSFPLGLYKFDVHAAGATYRFEWRRADDAVNTIIVSCLDLKADGDIDVEVTAALTDGDFYQFEGSDCHLGTIDLEAEFFSAIVSGFERDNMSVEVTYPQMSTPVQMQHVESFVSDEGLPMRIEWVEAPNFPPGAYLISVTINERVDYFRWDRRDDAFRTIILSCLPAESD